MIRILYWTRNIPHDTLEDALWHVEHNEVCKGAKIRIRYYSDEEWLQLLKSLNGY